MDIIWDIAILFINPSRSGGLWLGHIAILLTLWQGSGNLIQFIMTMMTSGLKITVTMLNTVERSRLPPIGIHTQNR